MLTQSVPWREGATAAVVSEQEGRLEQEGDDTGHRGSSGSREIT